MRDYEIIPITMFLCLFLAVASVIGLSVMQRRLERIVIVEATVVDVFRADGSDYEMVVRDGQVIEFIPITKKQFYLFQPQEGDCFRLEKHIQPKVKIYGVKIYGDYYEVLGECEQ
jgi:hypothetical protein